MKIYFHTAISKVAASAAALAVLVCCDKHDPSALSPIGFGNVAVAESGAAGTKAGGTDFGRDFAVCGVKTLPDGKQMVFPGYIVKYENATYNYEYGTQTVKYWDPQASAYAFWACSPASKASVRLDDFTATSSTITPAEALNFYYSDVKNTPRSEFGKTVQLSFNRLGSQVRFGFYETLQGMGIKELSVSVNGCFYSKASYLMSENGISVKDSAPSVSFRISLPGPLQSSKSLLTRDKDMTAWIPVLPLTATDLSLTIESCVFTQDGTEKTMELVTPLTVTIPQEYTFWNTNKDYTYIFQISSVKEDFNHIIFSFDQQIVRDWVDNGAEGIYDFQP